VLLLVGSEALVELGRPGVGCGELGGMRVLTDPWFTDSAHYHHGEPLGIALTALPHLDAVVVSHCHTINTTLMRSQPMPTSGYQ
jgi:hypothetical protein